jgi:hypothetical protein
MAASSEWGRYGIRPTGDRSTRRFTVTAPHGVTIAGRHYARGDSLARRQGENLRLAIDGGGWESWAEWQRVTSGEHYQGWQRQVAKTRGVDPRTLRKPDSDFNKAYVPWMRGRFTKSNRPAGRFARFLAGIGYRQPRAAYLVGDTPAAKGRGK